MDNWRTWKVGQKVIHTVNEFDGYMQMQGVVTEVHSDHAIVRANGMNLWVEDFNADMFR